MFEQIYSPGWLVKKPRYGYLLGLVFSIFGIFSAKIIFGSSPGLMSVAFTAMLLMPTLNKLISITEKSEITEYKFSIKRLINDHKILLKSYIFIFLGIFTTYAFFALVWNSSFTLSMFKPQLAVAGFTGKVYSSNAFLNILMNNLAVMIVCFLLSFFYGAGSILFLAWNASAWGSIFGFVANQSASTAHQNPFVTFAIMMIPILPHMLTEMISYFSATIVGGVTSKATLNEKWMSKRFKYVMKDAFIFFIIGLTMVILSAYLEVYIFPLIK